MANDGIKKGIIYQQLNDFFNLNAFGRKKLISASPNNKIIIRGNSPAEIKQKGLKIETLPGASNLNDIHDIEHFRDTLFTGLGIPKSFL